jgi:hypothetical protein
MIDKEVKFASGDHDHHCSRLPFRRHRGRQSQF